MKEDEGKRDYLFCLSIGYTRLKVSLFVYRRCNGHDCMVVGFAQKSDLLQVGGFLCVLRFPPPIKLTTTI
jgi:hypothetical protein